MNNFFDLDGPLFTILNRLSDIIVLNILWIVCSIPIFTIGASTTAMYYVALKMADGEEGYIARNFFKSFRENFKQSTIMWLIMLVIAAVIAIDIYIGLFVEITIAGFSINDVLFPVALLVAIIYFLILFYIFPLQSKFENKIKYTFKNAFLLSFRHLPYSIVFIAVSAGLIFLYFRFSVLFPLVLFFGIAGPAFGFAFLYKRIFNIYIKKPEGEEDESEENAETDYDAAYTENVWPLPEDRAAKNDAAVYDYETEDKQDDGSADNNEQ